MSSKPSSPRAAHRAWVMAAVDQYEQRLVRFAARLLGNEEAARDVVQHAFLQLCRQSPEKIESAERWLFRVVRHRVVDTFRRHGRSHDSLHGEQIDELVDPRCEPAAAFEQQEVGEILLELVDHLPAAQRESVLLWAEGWTSVEIGEISDRAPATVRVHLHKAFKTLRGHPAVRRMSEVEHTIANRGP